MEEKGRPEKPHHPENPCDTCSSSIAATLEAYTYCIGQSLSGFFKGLQTPAFTTPKLQFLSTICSLPFEQLKAEFADNKPLLRPARLSGAGEKSKLQSPL